MRTLSLLVGSAVIVMAFSAQAADLTNEVSPAPEAIAATTFDWTGFYLGVFGGLQQGRASYSLDFTDNSGSIFDNSRSFSQRDNAAGFVGGGKVGYDYQMGQFVIGAYADLSATSLKTDSKTFDSLNNAGTTSTNYELDYLGTVQARLGYAMDRFLVYGHGGFAYGDVTLKTNNAGDLDSKMKYGYTVGAGVEYAITKNVSLQTEYSYTNLGTDSFGVSNAFANSFSNGFGTASDVKGSESLDFHTITAGVNFRSNSRRFERCNSGAPYGAAFLRNC